MTLYCEQSWQETLNKQQLATFDQVWDFPILWIESPNDNRGGWSGVGRIEVMHQGQMVTLYVKKQLNHTTRTWRHPISGEPTFAKEFKVLQYLQSRGVGVPKVIFFGERQVAEGQQAILITENLAGFQPLDEVNRAEMMPRERRRLLRCVAYTVKKMHHVGIQHRALYPKHLFVKQNREDFDVAVIDLEKSRHMLVPAVQSISDLITLNYRSRFWTRTSRLYFLLRYTKQKKLNLFYKIICRWVGHRTSKK